MSNSEKLMNFMHFHNSCTRNCDRHILLIMTGNAHKESCYKLLLTLVRLIKMVVGGCFHNYRNKLSNDKPIFRCGAAPFLFILVALSS